MKYLLALSVLILAIGISLFAYDHYTTYIIYNGVKNYNVPGSMHGYSGLLGIIISLFGGILVVVSLVIKLVISRGTNRDEKLNG